MVTKAEYLARKCNYHGRQSGRSYCWNCRKPKTVCYCRLIKPFTSRIEFVILVHPEEARRHIASARMAHLNLQESRFVVGEDFSCHSLVRQLLGDPTRSCWMLYPGDSAVALDRPDSGQSFWQTVGPTKQATVFVVDGTWNKVGRMVNSLPAFRALPRLAFDPPYASRFRIRKQPAAHCWSTLEAIDYIIERTGAAAESERRVLRECFDYMVEQQLLFELRDTIPIK